MMMAGLQSAKADLFSYVKAPDPAFHWQLVSKSKTLNGTIYHLSMVSQVWEGITWKHHVELFYPKKVTFPGKATLLITGGNPDASDLMLGEMVANATGVPFAVLFEIPNQPLFDGRSEDALIAYTFVQYLHTGDANWPLLFPMVKSAVKAMDMLQAFSRTDLHQPIKSFIVTGASKRGWTTWLTGAADPARVIGIAPMVIEMLNLPAQMKHQLATWGSYSQEIEDYTKAGIQQQLGTPRGQVLAKMVDPYTYRDRLTMPKLIINGTNDPYWPQDAMNLYWNGLKGPKWVLYDPNSGHGLSDKTRVLDTMVAFIKTVAAGKELPSLQWKYEVRNKKVTLLLKSSQKASGARLWLAKSDTLDFRPSHWSSTPMTKDGGEYEGTASVPQEGNIAVFGELTYKLNGHPYTLSTEIKIAPDVREQVGNR